MKMFRNQRSAAAAPLVAALCLLTVLPAWGQLSVLGNGGTIRFGVQALGGPVAGGGTYNSLDTPIAGRFPGEMLNPGFNYPDVSPVPPAVVSSVAGPIHPGVLLGVQPPVGLFGGGHTLMAARAMGFRGGIYWPSFHVADFTAGGVTASTNVSNGIALLSNGPIAFNGYFGAFLGVRGMVNKPGGFVAASLAGRIQIFDNGGNLLNTLDPAVFLRSDGAGPRPDLTNSGIFVNGVPNPAGTLSFNYLALPGSPYFVAFGVVVFPAHVPAGGFIGLNGTLSLIADPAMVEVFTTLDDPNIISQLPPDFRLPDVGFFAMVPEPSSAALMLAGIGLTGVIGWYRRRA